MCGQMNKIEFQNKNEMDGITVHPGRNGFGQGWIGYFVLGLALAIMLLDKFGYI